MSSPSSEPTAPVFAIHLCSFAQEVDGLLTLVNAGLLGLLQGQSLHLAGFVVGLGSDMLREPLVISAVSGGQADELARVPQPPEQAIPDAAETMRLTVAIDLSKWSADAATGSYEIVTKFAGGTQTLPLHIEGESPARAE